MGGIEPPRRFTPAASETAAAAITPHDPGTAPENRTPLYLGRPDAFPRRLAPRKCPSTCIRRLSKASQTPETRASRYAPSKRRISFAMCVQHISPRTQPQEEVPMALATPKVVAVPRLELDPRAYEARVLSTEVTAIVLLPRFERGIQVSKTCVISVSLEEQTSTPGRIRTCVRPFRRRGPYP